MLCAVQRHQSLNTSICLDSASFDSPPFFEPLLPGIDITPNPHPRADISFSKVDSGLNTQLQRHIVCSFLKIWDDSAARRLSHVSKDESFSGLDPVKPKRKCKKSAYEEGKGIIVVVTGEEDIEQLHASYRLEHALESLRVGNEQRSKDSLLSSDAASSPNPSTLFPEAQHQLTFAWSVSAPGSRFKEQNHGGPPFAPSRQLFLQTETTSKITTLNSLYDPGSADSARSTPTESLSTTSSPVLKQAHPQLFPDNFNQGGRRDSVVSDCTLAPSPPPRNRLPQYASQGDAVLISFLAPDQPHIAIRAGESPLFWPSGSESAETDMEGGSGGQDGEGGGGSGGNDNNNSRSVSRQQSNEGLRGNQSGGSGDGDTTSGGAAKGGDGGGDERKGNSGDGDGKKGGGGGDNDKEKDSDKKKNKDKGQLTSDIDAMDVDGSSEEKPTNGEQKTKMELEDEAKEDTPMGGDGNAMEVEVSSSETAVSSLMALAGAAGKDQQPLSSAASLPGMFATSRVPWAPTAHAQTSPGGPERGPPPSPGPSNQLFQNNKLPLPNSPPSLPSIMNAQSASSPNSLPPGGDGRHTTLPPVSSIHVLADIAEKESSHQSSWGNNRMPPNSKTVYPTVSSHVSVAPSNRSAQAAQSPGLPPPAQAAHGYGPDGNPRPPTHHLSLQQRQYYINQDSPPAPYYPGHPHQHYHAPYPPIKEGSQTSSNGNSSSYAPNFGHGRDLPNILGSPTPTGANFFAQAHTMPSTIGGRRDSTLDYYGSDHTPSGPSTGDTMPSSGTDDTMTSPRNRPVMPISGHQGGSLAAGVFKCEYPGCKAQPFQTQYLLNSHANVHSSARPHYCPVKGCSRAEGGKGFKRKNEMIRHGLVHDSPGYVCPFCPDREHKYPRPDNLQRHVRVHHMDKDKDDPQLRDVLSQRPEGGNRGRRRRLGT